MGVRRLAIVAGVMAVSSAVVAAAPPDADGVHAYVLGRHAFAADQIDRASRYFASALASDPDDPVLMRRTFDLALAAGEESLANRLAERLAVNDRYDTTIGLVRVAAAVKRKDWDTADRLRADLAQAGFAAFTLPIVEAWTLVGRGRADAALARLTVEGQDGFARVYTAEHRAHVLAAAGRWSEAAAAYDLVFATDGQRNARFRLSAADALQRAGRNEDAARLLATSNDPALVAAAARLAAGKPIGRTIDDPREGIAELFTRLGADLAREKPLPIALVVARLATFLAPASDDAWLVTADVLARNGQNDAALAALERVDPKSVIATQAAARRAGILQQSDRTAESLALLQGNVASPEARYDDWARLGEAYSRLERFGDAAAAFDKALAMSQADAPDRWYLLYARGGAYERAGDWKKGEADLRAALALAPGEAAILNYLGYAMLDRGERLAEATQLIEKAVAAKPDDGYIIDSLGWAYYRAGRYAQAATTLERAVAEVPDDPTINEHLGDAYWKLGRRTEARFRWKAALDGGPDKEATARVSAKLDYGLDAAALVQRKP
jgi:tetratricopeptide (TPR) repeat protein